MSCALTSVCVSGMPVTAIGVRAMAMRMEPPPFHFMVDRPFFMAIRERHTGLILFLGAISDPR